MKLVLSVGIFIACIVVENCAINDNHDYDTTSIYSKCQEKEGVSEMELSDLTKGKFSVGDAPKSIMCYLNCVWKEYGILEDGGLVNGDAFVKFCAVSIGEEKAREIYDLCKGEVGDGECETPFKISLCYRMSIAELS